MPTTNHRIRIRTEHFDADERSSAFTVTTLQVGAVHFDAYEPEGRDAHTNLHVHSATDLTVFRQDFDDQVNTVIKFCDRDGLWHQVILYGVESLPVVAA